MHLIGYPDLQDHKEEHLRLTLQVKKYQREFYYQQEVDPSAVRDFLKEWHILETDMKIKDFLKAADNDLGKNSADL
jgi:hemerythrin